MRIGTELAKLRERERKVWLDSGRREEWERRCDEEGRAGRGEWEVKETV